MNTLTARQRWTRFAAPSRFYGLAGRLIPWCWAVTLILGAAGLWVGFAIAPTDFQQGDAYRILFVHVPVAWMSIGEATIGTSTMRSSSTFEASMPSVWCAFCAVAGTALTVM